MKLTDKDRQLARTITTFLAIPEFEDWQIFVLSKLLANEVPAQVRGPYSPCDAFWDNSDPSNVIRCGKPRGHGGKHLVTEGMVTGTTWTDDEPETQPMVCGTVNLRTGAACVRPLGHSQNHRQYGGMYFV